MKINKKLNNENSGQISAELILLIGIIITITLICGNYIYNLNSNINNYFSDSLKEGEEYLFNKI